MARPSYGAITGEYTLETPMELRADPRSLAFSDFYVDAEFVGARNLKAIREIYDGAFVSDRLHGVYVSCSWDLNPEGRDVDYEVASARGGQVARIITDSVLRL